jgi:putative membrane protein
MKKDFSWKGVFIMLGTIVRFIVSALVLLLVGYLLPGITVSGFVGALIAAVVIAVLGYIVEAILGDRISPRSRGIVGFITAAVVIYVAQFIIPSYLSVSLLGSLLAAFVIGLVDAFIPTEYENTYSGHNNCSNCSPGG